MKQLITVSVLLGMICSTGFAGKNVPPESPKYQLAIASFAPINTDIFIANSDGSNASALLSSEWQDYNPSFTPDGKAVIFTSDRYGSADIFRTRLDGTRLEKLVTSPHYDDQAAISPDGRWLAFVSSRSGQADIWILDLLSKKLFNLTSHPAGDFRPSWSPNGEWIAFTSDRDSTKPKGNNGFETMPSTEIYLIRPDGSELKRVTTSQAFVGSPKWALDGKSLVFYSTSIAEVRKLISPRDLGGTTQIESIDLRTNERTSMTAGDGIKLSPSQTGPGRYFYSSGGSTGGIESTIGERGVRGEFLSPAWSSDGKRMTFARDVGGSWPPLQKWNSLDKDFSLTRTGIFPSYSHVRGQLIANDNRAGILHNNILSMGPKGDERRTLYSHPEKNSLAPVWSPDGTKIAFALGRFFQNAMGPAVADIAVINGDGTGLRLLTKGDGNYGFPSWAPDSNRIVYRRAGKGGGGLSIVDSTTGQTRILTSTDHDNFPQWGPDGTIAFTGYRDGDYEIYTISPEGTNLRRLTSSPGNDAHCSWSPDGKWIAFSSERQGFKDEAVLHKMNPQPYGEIFVMRADGTDVRMLTDNPWEEATPNWFPLTGRNRIRED